MFRTCMHSCRHNIDTPHNEHFCKDHAHQPKTKTQQSEWHLPTEPEDSSQRLLRLQEELSQKVNELRQKRPPEMSMTTKAKPNKQAPPAVKNPVQLETSDDEDRPGLVSSSEDGDDHYGGKYNYDSSSEEDDESEVAEAGQQREQEEMSGKLDFDYHDALLVTPASQLRNRIKNVVETI